MFRAAVHTLICSEKVYFSSNGSCNYKSLPTPPTPAPSFAPPTPAVTPPTPAVGMALSTAVTPDNSTTRSGEVSGHVPDNVDEVDKIQPTMMLTTYRSIQVLKNFVYKNYDCGKT